jgi:hypothetical protein
MDVTYEVRWRALELSKHHPATEHFVNSFGAMSSQDCIDIHPNHKVIRAKNEAVM